jgi:2-amino-4-hydroxy-6-hydroxymethyldihydropteridine diphosphokinase
MQPDFYNAAVCLMTAFEPHPLLSQLLEIERKHGRIRDCRWGPRRLDLDILWIDGTTVHEPGLTVPHARLLERNFALIPLIEVAPGAIDPNTGKAYRDCPSADRTGGMRLIGATVDNRQLDTDPTTAVRCWQIGR